CKCTANFIYVVAYFHPYVQNYLIISGPGSVHLSTSFYSCLFYYKYFECLVNIFISLSFDLVWILSSLLKSQEYLFQFNRTELAHLVEHNRMRLTPEDIVN